MIINVGYQNVRGDRLHAFTEQATGHTYWEFEVSGDATVEAVADAVFEADNSPYALDGLAGQIRDRMDVAYLMTAERHHSLSVGDRVRVGNAEVICASAGWTRVS